MVNRPDTNLEVTARLMVLEAMVCHLPRVGSLNLTGMLQSRKSNAKARCSNSGHRVEPSLTKGRLQS